MWFVDGVFVLVWLIVLCSGWGDVGVYFVRCVVGIVVVGVVGVVVGGVWDFDVYVCEYVYFLYWGVVGLGVGCVMLVVGSVGVVVWIDFGFVGWVVWVCVV